MFLSGRPMSILGLMGFLMLVGIAVNNGIYLVDGTNQLRRTVKQHRSREPPLAPCIFYRRYAIERN